MERVHNVIKRSQKMAIEAEEKVTEDKPKGPKRRRKDEKLARYPITENNEIMEDKSTIEKFKSAIGTELARSKPRDAILLPLMKSTYPERRMYILGEPISLFNVLQQYPALKRPAIVSCINALLDTVNDKSCIEINLLTKIRQILSLISVNMRRRRFWMN